MNPRHLPALLACVAAGALLIPAAEAARKKSMSKPDFTKGDPIPEGAKHDWNLGATGMRGWIYSDKLVTTDARQILVTKVEKGSPADGKMQPGDVILGVAGKPFSFDPRTEFGRALTKAESKDGKFSLLHWRDGKQDIVELNLPVFGVYSATAPYDCTKSAKILELGCESLAKRVGQPNYRQNPITRSLNALALLASGEEKYLPIVKKEVEWASSYSADSMATWYYGYVIMLLAEYQLATGDGTFMPGLKRLAMEAAEGQSMVGSWGHKFAGPDDRLVGYGMMNAPGLPLTTSLVIARAAGVKDPAIDLAIERSAKLLRFYKGKGSIPYGDHAPWTQTHDDNGKNGMASVLFSLMDEPKTATFFARMSLASHGAERDTGHTGNFWNMTWALPGVAQSGPQATGAWMKEFGSWYFDLARRWDGSFLHQGPPAMSHDKTNNWDASGAYLLAYARPLKVLWLTGKQVSKVPQVDAAEAELLIRDGRGWNNKDRNSAYDKLSGDLLFEALGSWSPTVRGRAAAALARRKDTPVEKLIESLDSTDLHTNYGACLALGMMRGEAASAVPALRQKLKHEDLWLRIQAADALGQIGEPALAALPDLLEMISGEPAEDDPRNMEQRYVSVVVFGKMLRQSHEKADPEMLRKAIIAGLQNQDGRSRGSVGSIFKKLSFEEIQPLLPAIHEAVVTPAPSGIMFADGVRLEGLDILAKYKIEEGMPLCIDLLDINRWNKKSRIARCFKALMEYEGAAKPMLPRLRQVEQDLLKHREKKMMEPIIEQLRQMMRDIENSTNVPQLRSLKG
ncbi:MAG: DUF6288 domain-containing protein [Haloferula sp.]